MTERSGGSATGQDIDKAVDKAVGEAELAWAAATCLCCGAG